jgi:hypothetical protein
MKKIVVIIVLVFSSAHAFSQKGFACDLSEVDTLLGPTEKCILNCIQQLPLEKNLGHCNLKFFDSLINCSYKRIDYISERKGYLTTAVFNFSDNLHIRFYFKKVQYVKGYNPTGKWDIKLMMKETPSKLKIFYSGTPFCEMGSLSN